MMVSQRVQASALEEINLAEEDKVPEPKTILIAKDMLLANKQMLINLVKQYKDVFA